MLEVLIVIAIASVLVILSTPALTGLQARSKETKCVSNLRQIGISLLLYASENNGLLIPRNDPVATDVRERYWHGILINRGYVKDPEIFYCPSFAPFNNRTPGISNINTSTGQCYGMRDWRTLNGSAAEFTLFKKITTINSASNFFLVGDSYWKSTKSQGYSIVPGAADANSYIHLRHSNNAANLLFADGSVRSITRSYVEEINISQALYGRGTGFLIWPLQSE